ncbi:MAG: molybdenum cofactor biosynthesis protein MoaE [Nitrospinota bacterium]|nr:molybdenum cofactor biosynthesis protein MoaE [Nitrospinota bacterium]
MTRIQQDDFSMDREIALCLGDRRDAGGVATFVGIVRDISKDKKILKIEFSHYGAMADKELAGVRRTAMERFDIINLSIVHRVGTLFPGDRIVGIAAVARHRGPAFEACEFAITELKKKVPIWKKEFTEEGEEWVEETP